VTFITSSLDVYQKRKQTNKKNSQAKNLPGHIEKTAITLLSDPFCGESHAPP